MLAATSAEEEQRLSEIKSVWTHRDAKRVSVQLWELSLSSQLITGWLRLKTVAVRFCISRVKISKEIFVLLSGVTGPVFRERCLLTAGCAVLPVLPVLIGLLAIVTAVCSHLLTG